MSPARIMHKIHWAAIRAEQRNRKRPTRTLHEALEPYTRPDDVCEHGLSAWLCVGPSHYPTDM
jgi:hypothetical protein